VVRIVVGLLGALVAVVLLALVALVATTPSPIEARGFDAGAPRPLAGLPRFEDWSASCVLSGAQDLAGPEDLELDAEGRLYTGLHDGRVMRLVPKPDGTVQSETLGTAPGRPNGVTALRDGSVLVSYDYGEPGKRVGPDGGVQVLDWLRGADAAVGSDGTVYHPVLEPWKRTGRAGMDFMLMLLEAAPSGELHATDPATGRGHAIATGLFMPDGVALSKDEDFLVVGEFGAARITRVWLRGANAGRKETLVDLPGFPDGIASDGAGTFYVALAALRSPVLDRLHAHPRAKELAARLGARLAPHVMPGVPEKEAKGTGVVLAFDERGVVTRAYVDPTGVVGPAITTVEPLGDHLWVSSLMGWGVARCAR
jgi:sugar lactone lactonase YvrE